MSAAPIILFCYNRVEKTSQVIENLKKNKLAQDSELFVFCDGPRGEKDLIEVKKVHELLSKITGFKKVNIKTRDLNFGLKNSVIYGINKVFETNESAIIIEDDIVTSENFLHFMNESLSFYKNDQRVISVSGFNYPNNIFNKPKGFTDDVFFLKGRICSWGWGIWKDRWSKVDFTLKNYEEFKNNKEEQKSFNKAGANLSEMLHFQMQGKIDAWDIFLTYHAFQNSLHTVFPIQTLVKNNGFDGSGSHKDFNQRMVQFTLNDSFSPKLKNLEEIKNNLSASKEYILSTGRDFQLISRKKLLRLRYIALGFFLGAIITLLIS
jgi:GR25 family glycosyltransferase involved in LPS biosynthesis